MELNNIKALNKKQLLQCIKQSGFADVANILSMEDINGETLMTIPEIHILQWKMPIGERKKVVKFINGVKKNPSIILNACSAISEKNDASKAQTENAPENPNPPKANPFTGKPSTSTPQQPKPSRANKTITKSPMPLPKGARTKDSNLPKNKFESTVNASHADIPKYDNKQIEEQSKIKMNNLSMNTLESDESYIEMGNTISKAENYLLPNRSMLTIENQLEEPSYETPSDKLLSSSSFEVGSVSDKKVKLKLGSRDLPELPSHSNQSVDQKITNHLSVNVEKKWYKPPVGFSFLHGIFRKNLVSKRQGVLEGDTSTIEVEKDRDVNRSVRPLPEVPSTNTDSLRGLEKSSVKESEPPLMPKAKKPSPRIPPQCDHEAIYENAVDEEMYGNVVTTEDLAILRRKYQKNSSPLFSEREATIDKLASNLAEQLKHSFASEDSTDLEANNDNGDDDFDSLPEYGNTTSENDAYQNDLYNSCLQNEVNITKEPYFRNTDRKGAKRLLAKLEDGAFMFRPSKSHFLVLTIKYKDDNRHFGIKRNNNKLRLDADSGSEVPDFRNLKEFVEYFMKNAISFESNDNMFEIYLKPVLSGNIL